MKFPQISVIVTTYNHELWVRQCLDSVLNQRGVNIEVIVHDDCSTDNTPQILEEYASKCTIIRNQSGLNVGVSRAANKMLDLCRGRYVALMSGDDAWDESKLIAQYEYLESNKSVDICFTDSVTMDEEGNIGPRFAPFQHQNLNRQQWIIRLLSGNCLPAMSAVLRRNTWVDSNRFDVTLRQLQDWDYWIRAISAGLNFHIIQEPLVKYRVRAGSLSISNSPEKKSREAFETIACLKSFLNLGLGEFRAVFGRHIENSSLFSNDRSIQSGLAVLLSMINRNSYKAAAAEILRDHYLSKNNRLLDGEYHDFIGSLNL